MRRGRRFALIGKSGSGKSAASQFLSQSHQIRLIKTGTICRQIARLLFGNEDKRSTQTLDDALTQVDPSIFLRAALRGVAPEEGFVLDALRFREDLLIAQDLGCILIRVTASDETRLLRLAKRGQVFDLETDGQHRSEVELDDVPVNAEFCNEGKRSRLDSLLSAL